MFKTISVKNLRIGDIVANDIYYPGEEDPLAIKNSLVTSYIKEKLEKLEIAVIDIVNQGFIKEAPAEETLQEKRARNKREFKKQYTEGVTNVRDLFTDITKGKKIELDKIECISGNLLTSSGDILTTVESIDEIKLMDDITYSHSINVSLYAMMMGKWMDLGEKELSSIVKAGILHDIGKAKVDQIILNKPGKLTDSEFDHIKKHTVYGYDVCRPLDFLDEDVKKAVLMHHEKLDGTGYPLGVSSKNIPVFARIIGICDVYDALNSKRVYKEKQTPFDTFNQIADIAKGKLDEDLLRLFLKNVVSLYKGAMIRMSTGEIGEVIHINSTNISKPIIKIANNFFDLSKDKNLKIEEML